VIDRQEEERGFEREMKRKRGEKARERGRFLFEVNGRAHNTVLIMLQYLRSPHASQPKPLRRVCVYTMMTFCGVFVWTLVSLFGAVLAHKHFSMPFRW
jgi:hypothetical protein